MTKNSIERSGYLFPDMAPKREENKRRSLCTEEKVRLPVQDAEKADREIIMYASNKMRQQGLYFKFRSAED